MRLGNRVWSVGKLVVLVAALMATYALFAAIAMRVAVRAREVQVPDLLGRSVQEATALAAAMELIVRVDDNERPDPKVPAGHVLGQDPAAGSSARRQRSVHVWVSSGPRAAVAPRLLGESERAAVMRITQEGFTPGPVAEIRSSDYAPDVVVAQDPAPGAQTTEVRVLVNRGEDRATYVMPDLIGVNGDRAADVMRARGFRVAIVAQQASPGIPPGVVLRQTPAGGYQVHPGDAISLEVSR
jgi:serine/threonine-protein kinase